VQQNRRVFYRQRFAKTPIPQIARPIPPAAIHPPVAAVVFPRIFFILRNKFLKIWVMFFPNRNLTLYPSEFYIKNFLIDFAWFLLKGFNSSRGISETIPNDMHHCVATQSVLPV
jgi:hypothetical protein